MTTTTTISKVTRLPVVSAPNLEQKTWLDQGTPLLSISESLVLLQSLQRSRQTWLTSAFPKYIPPPSNGTPRTTTVLGTADLEAGPHIFPATRFVEVIYPESYYARPQYPPSTSVHPYYQQGTFHSTYPSWPTIGSSKSPAHVLGPSKKPSSNSGSSNPTAPQTGNSAAPVASSSTAPVPTPPNPAPLTSSPDSVALIQAAADKDPELRRLLALMADGKATTPDKARVTALIQAVLNPPTPSAPGKPAELNKGPSQPTSSTSTPPTPKPVYPPATQLNADILVEFPERPGDLFILPLSSSLVDRVIQEKNDVDPGSGRKVKSCDVMISTVLPISAIDIRQRAGYAATLKSLECQPVTLKVVGVPSPLWQAISRKVQMNDLQRQQRIIRVIQDMLNFVPPRVYLQLRQADGPNVDSLRVEAGLMPQPVGLTKRKDPPTDAEPLGPIKKTKQKYYHPSGLQVEVVIPLSVHRSLSVSTSTSGGGNIRAASSVPSITSTSSISRMPNPNLRVEVEIPRRPDLVQKAKAAAAAKSTAKLKETPGASGSGTTVTMHTMPSTAPVAPYPPNLQRSVQTYHATAAAASAGHYIDHWNNHPYHAYSPTSSYGSYPPYPYNAYAATYHAAYAPPPPANPVQPSASPSTAKLVTPKPSPGPKRKLPTKTSTQTTRPPSTRPLEPSPPPPSNV